MKRTTSTIKTTLKSLNFFNTSVKKKHRKEREMKKNKIAAQHINEGGKHGPGRNKTS